MKHRVLLGAIVALCAGQAEALPWDNLTTSFRGFRVEGDIGYGRFQSQGRHDYKLGYGGAGGFDGQIGDRIVIGAEGSYWHGRGENVTTDANGGVIRHKTFHEIGVAVRGGYLVTPALLVYGKGGYGVDEQRKSYSGVNGVGGFYDHVHSNGFTAGGGAEYTIRQRFYVNVEYKYSNYYDHTARQRLFGGVGVRFP